MSENEKTLQELATVFGLRRRRELAQEKIGITPDEKVTLAHQTHVASVDFVQLLAETACAYGLQLSEHGGERDDIMLFHVVEWLGQSGFDVDAQVVAPGEMVTKLLEEMNLTSADVGYKTVETAEGVEMVDTLEGVKLDRLQGSGDDLTPDDDQTTDLVCGCCGASVQATHHPLCRGGEACDDIPF